MIPSGSLGATVSTLRGRRACALMVPEASTPEAPGLPAAGPARGHCRARHALPVSLPLAHAHLLGGPSCPPVRCPTKL